MEGAAADRQVRGAVGPAHPAEPVAPRETLSADPCVSLCECVALIRHLVKLQEACDAKANHRGRGVLNAMDVEEKKSGPRKPRNTGRTWRG